MSRVSTYLNFKGTTEEAFSFYSSAFGTEITGGITRVGDLPAGRERRSFPMTSGSSSPTSSCRSWPGTS